MDQRLAGMAGVVEPVTAAQRIELAAQARHAARRRGERGAGPDPGMDRERDRLALLLDRHDQQVERDAAMHVAEVVGLDDQRPALVGARFEPGESAFVGGFGEQHLRAAAADAQLVLLAPVAVTGDVTQLGQHARIEPVEQLGPFIVGCRDPLCIARHGLLQRGPVGDCRAHVGKRFLERFLQLAAGLGIDARGLDVDHRFPIGLVRIAFGDAGQPSVLVALDRDDRVDQAVDRQPQRGNRRGDRINQEGHIVIDDCDAREAAFVANAFDRHGRTPKRTLDGQLPDELRGVAKLRLVEWRIAAEQRQAHSLGDRILEGFRKDGSCRTHKGPLFLRRMIVSAPRNIRVVCATTCAPRLGPLQAGCKVLCVQKCNRMRAIMRPADATAR